MRKTRFIAYLALVGACGDRLAGFAIAAKRLSADPFKQPETRINEGY